jgi:hypothetical protein
VHRFASLGPTSPNPCLQVPRITIELVRKAQYIIILHRNRAYVRTKSATCLSMLYGTRRHAQSPLQLRQEETNDNKQDGGRGRDDAVAPEDGAADEPLESITGCGLRNLSQREGWRRCDEEHVGDDEDRAITHPSLDASV